MKPHDLEEKLKNLKDNSTYEFFEAFKKQLKENPYGLRRVVYKKFIPVEWEHVEGTIGCRNKKEGTGCYTEMNIEGLFHAWGQTWEEFQNGVGNSTVAIIEDLETGDIGMYPPSHFKFKRSYYDKV